MSGVEQILSERVRQKLEEGWTPSHDDEHTNAEMVRAAEAYIGVARHFIITGEHSMTTGPSWPWDMKWWKPSPDPIRNLVKAGALIAAEIDRLKRVNQRRDKVNNLAACAKKEQEFQTQCDNFNKAYPVGTAVTVTKDLDEKIDSVTRSEAWVMGGHMPVIMIEGISGGYKLNRVAVRNVTKRPRNDDATI